jgi:hypothetical protein
LVILWVVKLLQVEVVLVVERQSFEPEVGLELEKLGQSVLYLRK